MKNYGVWRSACLVAVCLWVCSASAPAQEDTMETLRKSGLPVAGAAQEKNVIINLPGVPVWDVLHFYEALNHRPVYLSLDVQARLQKTQNKVTLVTPRPVSSSEAGALMRKALVDSCGVEVHDNGTGEILVSEPPPATGKSAAVPSRPPA